MSRQIKRVPLDFNWPLSKIWEGFLNPHYKKCPEHDKTCFNGYTAAGMWLESIIRLLAIAGENGRNGPRPRTTWPHPYLQRMETAPSTYEGQPINPTPELGLLTERLAGRPASCLGHDAIDIGHMRRKICQAADLPDTWGVCPVCEGDAMDPACKEAYEAWEPVEPPEGPGWQLWEDVTEGSPISPVFATKEEFAEYLVEEGYSKEAVDAFIERGWAMSMAMSGGVLYRDIESSKV